MHDGVNFDLDSKQERILDEQIEWKFGCQIFAHSTDNTIKLLHHIYADKETIESGTIPLGAKRMIGGKLLENVEANYNEIHF